MTKAGDRITSPQPPPDLPTVPPTPTPTPPPLTPAGVPDEPDLDVAAGSLRSAAAARLRPAPGSELEARAPLDRLAALAARLLGAPAGQLSLVADAQLVVGSAGRVEGTTGTRSAVTDALCAIAVATSAPLVVTDATNDVRVAHLPPVTSGAVGSYLGVPLTAAEGHAVGAICVFGPQPRTWSEADVALLGQLAGAAMAELELSAISAEHRTNRLVLDLAIEAAQIGIFDLDLVTGTRSWDDRMLELFGSTRETFDPRLDAFSSAVHPDDRARVQATLGEVFTAGGLFTTEYRVPLPDGTTRWVTARGCGLRDEHGRAVRVLGAAQDTTALRESEARSAQVLESMAVGYLAMDSQWRITYVNAHGERLTASARTELVGRDFWQAFPATVGTDFERNYRAAASGQVVTFDAYYPAPLNMWVEVRAAPEAGGVALYFLDITARRRAEAAREASTRRLSGLAEVALALVDADDVADLTKIIVERGLAALGADGGSVAVPDPDDPTYLLSYTTATLGASTRADSSRLPLDAALPVTVAAATGQRVLLADQAACQALSCHVVAANTATGCQAWASIPLRAGGQVIGVLTAGWTEPQTFPADQLELLEAFAAQCAQALQRLLARDGERAAARAARTAAEAEHAAAEAEHAAAEAARRSTAQQAGLVAVAQALGEAEHEGDVLAVVAEQGAQLLGANGSALCLQEPDGEHMRILTTETYSADVRDQLTRVPADFPLPAVEAATTGTPFFHTDRAETTAAFPGAHDLYVAGDVQASAAVALRARGRLLGCLSLTSAQARTWRRDEQDLLAALAALTAQALERIAAREAERAASRAVARFSETLQRSLLTSPPEPDHLQIAVRYAPATADAQVGGDWYDAFLTAEGTTSLVIGDVTGHDRDAAAAMGQLRNLLRGVGHAIAEPPALVLSALDRAAHDLAVGAMATVVMAQVDQSPDQQARSVRTLRWSNAGHLPPLLIAPDGASCYLDTDADLLLGLDPDAPRTDHDVELLPGSTVLLYTDGLVERRDAPLQSGLDWLATTTAGLAHLDLEELCDVLLALIGAQEDDVALLALRTHPEDAPRPVGAGPSTHRLTPTSS